MSLFVIADLHLSFGCNKPMDVFPGWKDYTPVSYTHLQELINFDKMIKRENNTLYNTAAGKQILLLRKCNFKLFGAFCFYSKLKE